MLNKQPTYEELYELAEKISGSERYRQLFLQSLTLSPYESNGSAHEVKRMYKEIFGQPPDRTSFRLTCSMLHQSLLHYFDAHKNELTDEQARAVEEFAVRINATDNT